MTGPRSKRLRRAKERWADCSERAFVNFSVEIQVVNRDQQLVHVRHLGGLYDPVRLCWVDEAPHPARRWVLSENQYESLVALERILEQGGPTRYVFVGGMGSGKTVGQAHAAAFFAFFRRNGQVGMVAPARPRLGILRDKFVDVLDPSWIVARRDSVPNEPPYITLLPQLRYQFVAAALGSRTTGSPIQGYDWQACFPDEEQNVSSDGMAMVALRGRAAVDGRYPVISTATIADTIEFRDRLAKYEADPDVVVKNMSLLDNPWIDRAYIETLRAQLTPRQWAQLVEGKPQPPERRTYQFDRAKHVRRIPAMGAVDITRRVIDADMLVGHDPGELLDVSILLKCYQIGERKIWWVVDELTTERTTTEQHAVALRRRLNERWQMQRMGADDDGNEFLPSNEPRCLIRADPHGSSDGKPDIAVYRHFKLQGFDIRPAAYRAPSQVVRYPQQASQPGTVKREARIEVVNTLLLSASNETRLYIHCDERGYPVAPRLATALEMSERDEFGRAEMQRKGEHDLSHWPSALGFALYSYERARLDPFGGGSHGAP